jgi:peptidoglycan/xylan/chitin deacetylase (PgdA/CDA1 family)
MVSALGDAFDRTSARRAARRQQVRRRRRAFLGVISVLILAAAAFALWPDSRAPQPLGAAAPMRFVPMRPIAPPPDSLRNLRAALPAADGVLHGNPNRRMVALTFDDGPSGRTPAILRVLAHHHAHATFFVVGRATRGMQPILRHIALSGNELGDHTYSHADLLGLKTPGRTRQLQWTRTLVHEATGIEPRFFRPPYGATGPAVNRLGRSLGLVPVLWSVDSRDWQLPGTKAIVRRVLANVRPGSIVLLHDGGGDRRETLRALPAILRALEKRHLQPVTLSKLLADVPPPTAFSSTSFDGGDARSPSP